MASSNSCSFLYGICSFFIRFFHISFLIILLGDIISRIPIGLIYLFCNEYGEIFFIVFNTKGLFAIGSPNDAIHLISGLISFIFNPISCDSGGMERVIIMSYSFL